MNKECSPIRVERSSWFFHVVAFWCSCPPGTERLSGVECRVLPTCCPRAQVKEEKNGSRSADVDKCCAVPDVVIPRAGTHAQHPCTASLSSQAAVCSGMTPPKDAAVSSEFPTAVCAGECSLPASVCSKACWIQWPDSQLVSLGFGISVQDFYALEWPCAFLDSKVSESECWACLYVCVFPCFWRRQKKEYELDCVLAMWQLMCAPQIGHCCWNKGK